MIAVGQPGHIDQIKQTNAGAVYRLIDQLGPISRIELSKRAQLAPASITKIVRELLEAHLVKEAEYRKSAAGAARRWAWCWTPKPGITCPPASAAAASRWRCAISAANWWWRNSCRWRPNTPNRC
ncbi:hypothetical protein M8494_12215 [Serratia ureilytica]